MKIHVKLLALMLAVITLFSLGVMPAGAAVTLPGVTQTLTATSKADSVTLTWKKVSGATGYSVYRSVDGKWTLLKNQSGVTYTLGGLTASSSYKFAVRAYRTVSGKNYLSKSYKTVTVKTKDMANMSALKATASASSVKLQWTKIPGASGYRIYRLSGGKWVKVKDLSNAYNTYTVSSLKGLTGYTFAVRPFAKTTSGVVWCKTYSKCTVKTLDPNMVTVKSATVGADDVTLVWNKAPDADGYRIYMLNGNQWVKAKDVYQSTTADLTGLKFSTEYTVRVRAFKKTNGTVTWFTLGPVCKFTTLSAAAKPYRIAKYQKILSGNEVSMSFTAIEPDGTSMDMSYAAKKGNYSAVTMISGVKVRVVYNKSKDTMYMLLDDFKVYTILPKEDAEDMDMDSLLGSMNVENVGRINVVNTKFRGKDAVCERYIDTKTGDTVKYYFDSKDNLLGYETIGKNGTSTVIINSMGTSVKDSEFTVPVTYLYVDISKLL